MCLTTSDSPDSGLHKWDSKRFIVGKEECLLLAIGPCVLAREHICIKLECFKLNESHHLTCFQINQNEKKELHPHFNR